MNINEPTKPSMKPDEKRFVSSPVTFAPIPEGANRISPVVMHDAFRRPTPVSIEEVRESLAGSDPGPTLDPAARRIVMEDSFFDAPVDFVLLDRHRDLQGSEIILRTENGARGLLATVVKCWQMVAGDVSHDQAKALGWENLDALAESKNWIGEDWEHQPVTVIQIER